MASSAISTTAAAGTATAARRSATVLALLIIGASNAFSAVSTRARTQAKSWPVSPGSCDDTNAEKNLRATPRSWLLKSTETRLQATAITADEDLLPGIAALDAANEEISKHLADVSLSPYFRLFSVDILASCEYMPQELFECYSETCEIYPIDDDEIPEPIKVTDMNEYEFELDGWARWDMPSDDYYDTEQFPDGYTGYDGSEVWAFIHNKICFPQYGYRNDHWKADFNKAVSGVHAVVSAQVVRGIREKVESGEAFSASEPWTDPAAEFARRLSPGGRTPKAMENLYYTYMLFLSALAKTRARFEEDCQSGKIDGEAAESLRRLLSMPILNDRSVHKPAVRFGENAVKDSDSASTLWEARMRSRELLRVINCVQCNKCRLHGKILTMGASTALQIHLGRDGKGADIDKLTRVELAALVASTDKLSRAIGLCKLMEG